MPAFTSAKPTNAPTSEPPNRAASATRILIIKPSALGDVCRAVPALVTLRRALPAARIDWLVNESYTDAIRHHPALDHAIAFPRQRFASFWRHPHIAAESLSWARRLAATRYDWVFDLQGLFRSGLLTRLTRAPHRVGFAAARELAWLGYNRRHPVDLAIHTVDRMLALLAAEGFPLQHDMRLYLNPDDHRWLRQHLLTATPEARYACIAPAARWRCKCWPIDRYVQIAQRLLDTRVAGSHLVVLASPQEQPDLAPLRQAFASNPRVLFPQTTVGQMMATISHATVLICNDSAPLHVAVGFNRPIVAIFGPTDPALVGPYRRNDAVLQPPHPPNPVHLRYRRLRDDQSLIAQVPLEAVWQKTLDQLSTPRP